MVAGTGCKLPDTSRHHHRLVGAPPDPERVDAWRRVLSRRDVEIFEFAARGLLETLGYTPLHARPRARTAQETLAERLWTLGRKASRLAGRAPRRAQG